MTADCRRVLAISGVFPPDRVAEADHAFRLCQSLSERGFDVDVLTNTNAVTSKTYPFRVHPLMSRWNWLELPRLLRAAHRARPDVVHLWYLGNLYHHHPMITFVPALLKRLLPGAAIVTQITYPVGAAPHRFRTPTRLIRKAVATFVGPQGLDYAYGTLLRDSDRIIAMAPGHASMLAQLCPTLPAKAALVPPPPLLKMAPPGADTRMRGRKALGLEERDFVFAYFGRLYQGKGLETLLRAFQILRERHSGIKLAIIGGADPGWSGSEWKVQDLHALAAQLGIAQEVVWSGEFPWESDLGSAYLHAADCAVLTFDNGVALNNSSFAAVAAHQLPTVTTRGEILDSPFLDGENVVLCPPRNPPAMADAMEQILVHPALRDRLRAGIAKLEAEWFSWPGSTDRTIAVFEAARTATRPWPRTAAAVQTDGV